MNPSNTVTPLFLSIFFLITSLVTYLSRLSLGCLIASGVSKKDKFLFCINEIWWRRGTEFVGFLGFWFLGDQSEILEKPRHKLAIWTCEINETMFSCYIFLSDCEYIHWSYNATIWTFFFLLLSWLVNLTRWIQKGWRVLKHLSRVL